MFIKGDVLHVKNEWLSDNEKKDPAYVNLDYIVRDSWINHVGKETIKVICASNNFMGYSVYTYLAEWMLKVGHVSEDDVKNYLKNIK